ncbi:MAG: MlaD family protein [Rhodospirillales bacterium]|nr:MlaD family protein [Rhodospirillales bacterium]MCW8861426.1 MlaD family protein [Rhodospirillales bacterium]MCW8953064.1 MlaD family protein [Rhodospirillales bacterium]MCW8970371.1 MlaD family protein [Rhodospirillales bacterium]MCW9040285.1 MlaD family protein [Rhodospirillales bacterium]
MTRNNETLQVVVGSAVLLLLVFTVIFLYSRDRFADVSDSYRITATFNRVDGLVGGAEVHLGGVRVGSVVQQSLGEDYRATVVLELAPEVKLPLDTSAAIHTDGLFGDKHIILEPGGEEKMIAPGGRIDYTQDSMVVEELLELIIAQGKARLAKGGNQNSSE